MPARWCSRIRCGRTGGEKYGKLTPTTFLTSSAPLVVMSITLTLFFGASIDGAKSSAHWWVKIDLVPGHLEILSLNLLLVELRRLQRGSPNVQRSELHVVTKRPAILELELCDQAQDVLNGVRGFLTQEPRMTPMAVTPPRGRAWLDV